MLPPLELNLATRPFRNNTLLWVGHGLAVGLLVGASVWNASAYLEASQGLTTLRASVASIERRMRELDQREVRAKRRIARHDLQDLMLRTKKANDVIRRKALSWTRLFNALEEVLPYDVRMISIRPVFLTRRTSREETEVPEGAIPVHVQGAARGGTESFVEFVRNLLDDRRFSHVDLERESHQGGELFFDMRFLYYPELDAEDRVPGGEPGAPRPAAEAAAGEKGA